MMTPDFRSPRILLSQAVFKPEEKISYDGAAPVRVAQA
jgi:hypothetical protein